MEFSRRSLFLITSALALRKAFGIFRDEPALYPDQRVLNSDPVEIRIGYFGHIACESPGFHRGRPIAGAVLDDLDALEPPAPPRWDRVVSRWENKHRQERARLEADLLVNLPNYILVNLPARSS